MRAAVEAGIQMPKLCATDSLEPFGSCRLCLVEIEGRRAIPASCTTPAEAGMKVRTQTPKLAGAAPDVMELYISDHPLDCLTCSANGNCELQDMAGVIGLREVRYGVATAAQPLAPSAKKDESNPYFTYDPSKCIVCNRCVRACEETQGTFALTISGRGFESRVSAGPEPAVHGLRMRLLRRLRRGLPDRHAAWRRSSSSMGQAEHSVITTCAYCGVGCGFKAEMKGNEVVRMVPWKDGKANEGHSCVKGRFAWGYATHQDRITKPMIRAKITDPWREVSLGRGDRLRRLASSSASRRSTAATRSAASPRRAAPTRRPTWCRSWCARPSATTTSTPAPACATRRPATAWARPWAPRPARRPSSRSSRPT